MMPPFHGSSVTCPLGDYRVQACGGLGSVCVCTILLIFTLFAPDCSVCVCVHLTLFGFPHSSHLQKVLYCIILNLELCALVGHVHRCTRGSSGSADLLTLH